MHLFLYNICCFLCLFACACLSLLHCECVCVWLFMGGQADAAEPTAAWRAIEAGTHTRVHTLYTHEHNFVYTTAAQTAHKCDARILKWHLKRHVEHVQIYGRTNMHSWTHTRTHHGIGLSCELSLLLLLLLERDHVKERERARRGAARERGKCNQRGEDREIRGREKGKGVKWEDR